MAKRTRARLGIVAPAGIDYGPSLVQRQDGRLVHGGGAARVMIETRDDPGHINRTIRGARRRDVVVDLCVKGKITKPHADAAARFVDDLSIAQGSSSGGGFLASGGQPRSSLPERQIDAIGRVRRVIRALGLNDGTVFWWVVVGQKTTWEWEAAMRMRRGGEGLVMLVAALDALIAHYDAGADHRRAAA